MQPTCRPSCPLLNTGFAMTSRTTLTAALLLTCAVSAFAQYPIPAAPGRAVAPLLHVRLLGPEGMHAVVYQGRAAPRDLRTPLKLGLRAGYVYRLELNGFTIAPGVSLYPTLEV